MKNILFAALLFISYSGDAQKIAVETAKVPIPTKFAFESVFPAIKGNAWFTVKKGIYTTTFEQSAGKEVRIWITYSGEIPKLLEDIDKKEMPIVVRELSDKRITASMKVGKYSRFTKKKYGLFKVRTTIIYRQSLSNEKHSWVNKYNEQGKYLGKERRKRRFRASF